MLHRIEKFDDEHGAPRWRIRHQNGNIIATSASGPDGYASKQARDDTVEALAAAINDPAQTITVLDVDQ